MKANSLRHAFRDWRRPVLRLGTKDQIASPQSEEVSDAQIRVRAISRSSVCTLLRALVSLVGRQRRAHRRRWAYSRLRRLVQRHLRGVLSARVLQRYFLRPYKTGLLSEQDRGLRHYQQ